MKSRNNITLNDDGRIDAAIKIDIYYSFDEENWHFIIIPWIYEGYPADNFLNWLDSEVENNKNKNIFVLAHSHYMPMGMLRLESYVQYMNLRKIVQSKLLKYNNVKYFNLTWNRQLFTYNI